MNRRRILQALHIVGVLLLAQACGPRMKPVEYQEPAKDLSSSKADSDEGSSDSSSSSASSESSSSSASSESSSSSASASEEGGGKKKFTGPCKDKKCGDACTECAPGDTSCMEILIQKQCNLQGECVPAPAECSRREKDKDKSSDKDKSKGKDKK